MENKVHSSTSNSNRLWLAQLVGGFLFIMIAASLVANYLTSHTWWATRDIQNPAFQNEVILERYYLDGKDKSVVIVGSSVSTQLPPDGNRPSDVATLFVQGGGGMTGLQAIITAGFTPKIVLVEADFLFRNIRHDLVEYNPQSFKAWLKYHLPILRDEQNTVNYLYKTTIPQISLNDLPKVSAEDWNKQLDAKIAYYQKTYEDQKSLIGTFPSTISLLKQQVDALEKRGCRIIFFAVPMDKRLKSVAALSKWQQMLRDSFPDNQFIYPPNDNYVFLVDGIHFFGNSGMEYFHYLMNQIGHPIAAPHR